MNGDYQKELMTKHLIKGCMAENNEDAEVHLMIAGVLLQGLVAKGKMAVSDLYSRESLDNLRSAIL